MTTAREIECASATEKQPLVVSVHFSVLVGTKEGQQLRLSGGIPASTDPAPQQKSPVDANNDDHKNDASIHAHGVAATEPTGQTSENSGKLPGGNGAGQKQEAAQAAKPPEPIDLSGETAQRLQGLTFAVQELRRDLESHCLEREQMPVFRQLMNVVQMCWRLLEALSPEERGSGAWATLEGTMNGLCSLLQFQGVEFLHSYPRAVFDPATMRSATALPAGAGVSSLLVARCCRPGFRLGQRILDYELVDVMPAAAGPVAATVHLTTPGNVL